MDYVVPQWHNKFYISISISVLALVQSPVSLTAVISASCKIRRVLNMRHIKICRHTSRGLGWHRLDLTCVKHLGFSDCYCHSALHVTVIDYEQIIFEQLKIIKPVSELIMLTRQIWVKQVLVRLDSNLKKVCHSWGCTEMSSPWFPCFI